MGFAGLAAGQCLELARFDRFRISAFGRCWEQTGHRDRAKTERKTLIRNAIYPLGTAMRWPV